ncbi:calmodulin-binding protein 60 B-like isoform X2 [Andrographis paniculata]|nr:calmodulin-binding protein 60 B-like isoform X2 [Andrographis paniculata]
MNYGRGTQESVHYLEPIIRKWVKEAVECAFDPFTRSSYGQIECSRSRTLQLQFDSTLAPTLFTGSRVLSRDRCPIKVVLYDSTSNKVVSSGPLSSIKVSVVVIDGDFETDDREDWTVNEFERKIVKNRDGKRPLVTGELTVALQNGVGHIGNIVFTDNSSWIRSGKFRLGVKVTNSDETVIREARSNAFKVKDHRGESYQKHYPPLLHDEVWRLEKIAKEGASHRKLTENGIKNVGDFLRRYMTHNLALRSILHHISNKSWDSIIAHAMTCKLEEKMYLFRTAQGSGLLFNSIYKVVSVTFDGQIYHSVDRLDTYQKRILEDLKQCAYQNFQDWVLVCEPSIVPAADTFANSNLPLPGVTFQEQDKHGIKETNTSDHTPSPPTYRAVEEQDYCGFMLGGSSNTVHGFNPTFRDSFGIIAASPGGFFIEGNDNNNSNQYSWGPEGGNGMGPQLLSDDLPIEEEEDSFQVKSFWQAGNEVFIDPGSTFCSNTGILNPSTCRPKRNWCKVLAVVKWRILARRRKWQCYYN